MKEETKKRGGKREGAGRKRTTCKFVGIKVPEDVAKILENIDGTVSAYIVDAIRLKARMEAQP